MTNTQDASGPDPVSGCSVPADSRDKVAPLRQALEQATQAAERFRDLFDRAPIPYQSLNVDGRLLEVNQAWLSVLGYDRGEVISRWFGDFLVPEQASLFHERFPLFKQRGHIERTEFLLRRRDGTTLVASFTGTIGCNADGTFRQTHCVFEDITERKKLQDDLQARNQALSTIFANAPHPMLLLTRDARVADINLSGQSFAGAEGRTILGCLCGVAFGCVHAREGQGCGTTELCSECPVRSLAMRTLASGQPVCGAEGRMMIDRNGRPVTLDLLISTMPVTIQGEPMALVSLVDITTQKQTECERQILLDVLTLVNTRNHTHELLRDVTGLLQEWSGCEAVGIRLPEGEDFPYFESRGFPSEFVVAENRLCAVDPQGELVRDSEGNPVLECMCGNVLCGRFDPALPFFTRGGSFWTNCTTDLLASTGEADRQTRTRNRCHGEGYESVALVPLRTMGQTFGLLQFNDKRKGMFDADRMAMFERVAANLALGLAQRRTAADLRRSEARFRSTFEEAPIGVAIVANTGHILECNATLTGILGYTREELQQRRVADITYPEDRSVDYALYQEVLAGRRSSYQVEKRYVRKDGTVVWGQLTGSMVRNAEGQLEFIIGALLDITERRRAEEGRRLHTAVMETVVEGILLVGLDDNIIKWTNRKCEEMFGYQPGEMIGMHVDRINAPTDQSPTETRVAIMDILRQTGVWNAQIQNIRKDGTVFWSYAHVSLFDHPEFGRVGVGAHNDITRLKQAELELRRHEVRLRQLFDEMDSGFALHEILCDANGRPCDYRFLEVNPAFERLTGLCASDVVGRTVRQVMPGIEGHWIEQYGQVALSGQPSHFESYSRDLKRWYHISAYCPQPGQFAVFFLDVTARRQAEMERLEMQRQLLHAQKLESLGILAGGVAHDFNNLLTVILGQGRFALKRLPPESPLRGNLEEAIQAARRAADLTRQMLAYSGKGSFVLEQVDLGALVRENAHLFRSVVPRTITMDLHVAADLPAVNADRGQIQQVVMNLITNASEAIGNEPGTIALTTSLEVLDEVKLACSRIEKVPPPGQFVCLTVSDTGCGMDEVTRQRLFDPFYTTKFAGRGLGMAVVMGVVKGHEGAILIDSSPGVGTTIRILFPLAQGTRGGDRAGSARDASSTETAGVPLQGLVLVVDDEQPVRDLCKVMLQSFGLDVLTAGDGQEGLEVFRRHAADIACVILDLSMPKMDGRRALAELQRIRPGVKVLLASGYGETEMAGHQAGEKPAGFLQKPFASEDLETAIRKVLGCEE